VGRLTKASALAAGLALLALAAAAPVDAQSRDDLTARCVDLGGGSAEAGCLAGALATEALLGGVGLALAGGSELPGSPSTIGRRFGASPRWALSGRAGLTQFDWPALEGDVGSTEGAWVPSLQGALAAGVFDGFRLGPTVGGFLSVDLLGTLGIAFLPDGDGFDGAATAWGYGARVGIVRESFTLPGITLALARRHGSGFRLGPDDNTPGVDGPGVDVDDFTVTSVRATVGKEFLALGIMGGLGWDRTEGDGTLRAPGAAAGQTWDTPLESTRVDRVLLVGALTRTWLVFQATAEGGFATGYDEDPAGGDDAFDPSAGSVFVTLSFRMLF
jgi:hypothetical protein